jgi:hypothetical protein
MSWNSLKVQRKTNASHGIATPGSGYGMTHALFLVDENLALL